MRQEEKSGYLQVCNKESRQSEVKEFSIQGMGRCKPLSSLNSLLSYAPPLSGANPVSCSLCFWLSPSSSKITMWGGDTPWIAVWGALIHIWRPEIADGCDISCLFICRRYFHFTLQNEEILN